MESQEAAAAAKGFIPFSVGWSGRGRINKRERGRETNRYIDG